MSAHIPTSGSGAHIPTRDVSRWSVLGISCPMCGALAGESCTGPIQRFEPSHTARQDALAAIKRERNIESKEEN